MIHRQNPATKSHTLKTIPIKNFKNQDQRKTPQINKVERKIISQEKQTIYLPHYKNGYLKIYFF